jgi:2-methylcitrate dehydratase PrpD
MKKETHNNPDAAARLIQALHSLAPTVIPAQTYQNAKRCLLDALGCGLFGASQPWSKILSKQMLAEQSRGQATLFGEQQTLSAPAAALCNGTAIHGFELDDLLPAALIHPGTVIIPATMAIAEHKNVEGEALLRAIIMGYEVTARMSIAMGTLASQQGFHKTSVVGPVASAIACAYLLNLNTAQITCAAGIAASMASGVKAYVSSGGGGMVKRMHAGWAASSGVRAALLAYDGFTGPSGAVDGRYGLLDAFGGADADPEKLMPEFGEQWAIDAVWFKVYPICGWIQGAVQLLTAMRNNRNLTATDVSKVVIGTSQFAVNNNSNPRPLDTMDAQYSLPYCVAVALSNNPSDPRVYEETMFTKPELLSLAAKVTIQFDAECDAVYPQRFGTRVQLHLYNGEVLEALTLDPHGTPADPCSDQELAEKFMQLAALAPRRIDVQAITNATLNLETPKARIRLSKLLRA